MEFLRMTPEIVLWFVQLCSPACAHMCVCVYTHASTCAHINRHSHMHRRIQIHSPDRDAPGGSESLSSLKDMTIDVLLGRRAPALPPTTSTFRRLEVLRHFQSSVPATGMFSFAAQQD